VNEFLHYKGFKCNNKLFHLLKPFWSGIFYYVSHGADAESCDDRSWWSSMVLWQLHQLPIIEECRQCPSAVVTYHGSIQLAKVKHWLLKPRLLHQHPQGPRVWILYAGMFWYCRTLFNYLFAISVYRITTQKSLLKFSLIICYLVWYRWYALYIICSGLMQCCCTCAGSTPWEDWSLPDCERQSSCPATSIYLSGSQAWVGSVQWVCTDDKELHSHCDWHQSWMVCCISLSHMTTVNYFM